MKQFEINDLSVPTMVADVEIIVSYSKLLLVRLEPRVSHWSPSTSLGDVFLQITDFMKVYTQYVQDYDKFRTQLQNYLTNKQASRPLSKFLKVRFSSLFLFKTNQVTKL